MSKFEPVPASWRVEDHVVYNGRCYRIQAIKGHEVVLDVGGQRWPTYWKGVRNKSEACRRGWVTNPRRAVGRRKGVRLSDRVSVTLRLDRDVWERFRALEESGAIEDRTEIVNRWVRQGLRRLGG